MGDGRLPFRAYGIPQMFGVAPIDAAAGLPFRAYGIPPKVAPASPELAAAERMHGGRRAAMAAVPQVPRAGAASPTVFGTGPFL